MVATRHYYLTKLLDMILYIDYIFYRSEIFPTRKDECLRAIKFTSFSLYHVSSRAFYFLNDLTGSEQFNNFN